MKPQAELYTPSYRNYSKDIYSEIRLETYGEDIGQTSWITASEYRDFISRLNVKSGDHILEIASGSGGPAVFLVNETGCRCTGIDINEAGVENARKLAEKAGVSSRMKFLTGDCSITLPFSDNYFDAVICIDSINHLKDRDKVLHEFNRVIKRGGKLLYTDPVVVTGIVSNDEVAERSSLGFFLFAPPGENERLLGEAGFLKTEISDVTENIASVSVKWHQAREKRKEELIQIEGLENFNALQTFFMTTHILSSERRLSRILFSAIK